MQSYEVDVLVIGSGAAGLLAAVKAAQSGARTLVAEKSVAARSGCTVGAQQLCALIPGLVPGDSTDVHFDDSVRSSKFIGDQPLLRIMVDEGAERIEELLSWGFDFDREPDGRLAAAPMAGHSFPRGLFRKDVTGNLLNRFLARKATQLGARLASDLLITRLVHDGQQILGAVGVDLAAGEVVGIAATAVVLATGGAGMLYPLTTNPIQSTGDGVALALAAGVEMVDLEFYQFYPCTSMFPMSMRGHPIGVSQWSRLYNSEGERFMARYSPSTMEKATRDALSIAIYSEVQAGRGTPHGGVWLDATGLDAQTLRFVEEEFKICRKMGVDLTKERAEVRPGAHYYMGGVRIDAEGRSSLPGLFAAGEVSGGIHGANRLGNNSVLDCLVYGARAGRAAGALPRRPAQPLPAQQVQAEAERLGSLFGTPEASTGRMVQQLQQTMWDKVGVIRNSSGLQEAAAQIAALQAQLPGARVTSAGLAGNMELQFRMEAEFMLTTAEALVASARRRTESRGAHQMSDYPEQDDTRWLRNILVRQTQDGLVFAEKPPAVIGAAPESVQKEVRP